jgi:hypothetical protein
MAGLMVSTSLRFLFRPLLSGVETSGSSAVAVAVSGTTTAAGFCVGWLYDSPGRCRSRSPGGHVSMSVSLNMIGMPNSAERSRSRTYSE